MAKPIRFDHTYNISIAWGDMDAFGHVNNVVYVKYFETARANFFTDLSVWNTNLKTLISGPILTHLELDYRKQVSYPADLEITLGITSFSTRSFDVSTSMWDKDGHCVISGFAKIVWFDFENGRPTSITESMKATFQKMVEKYNA
ncbi:MAG: acyl-CoA thioesterase [Leptospira sp.]|nr:acyl-CoA thioesterase [Leptospira sp.]NCS94269.1 acyl-CoA thioesterase [Leptospira sp.]